MPDAVQTSLFEEEPAGPKLTDRQRFALEQLRRHRDGLTQDELGALLHVRKGRHDDWQRCNWCSQDGLGVLKALRKKELVARRRSGQWQLTKVERGVVDLDVTGSGKHVHLSVEGDDVMHTSTHAPAGNGDSGNRGFETAVSANTPSGEVPVRPSHEYDPATAAWPEGF